MSHKDAVATFQHTLCETCASRSKDTTLVVMTICKGKPGQKWLHLFKGDPDGARCMQPLYTLTGQPFSPE